jgi:hypothetical protein
MFDRDDAETQTDPRPDSDPDAVGPTPTATNPPAHSAEAELLLARIEKNLAEMRAHMHAASRESRHKQFSFTLLAGGIAQAVVMALLFWALSDIIFVRGTSGPTPLGVPLVKLAFAGVLQLVALTAFSASRSGQ